MSSVSRVSVWWLAAVWKALNGFVLLEPRARIRWAYWIFVVGGGDEDKDDSSSFWVNEITLAVLNNIC